MALRLDPLVVRDKNYNSRDEVTIFVGNEIKLCKFNRMILFRYARSFRTVATFASNSYTLRDVKPDTFELYLHYLLTGEIACRADVKTEGSDHLVTAQDIALVDFYVLACKINDPIAMHTALRAFISDYKKWENAPPNAQVMKHAFKVITEDSPLYKLFVALFTFSKERLLIDDFDEYPKSFIVKVLQATRAGWEDGDGCGNGVGSATCCDYHERDGGLLCVGKKRKREKGDEDLD